jgi:hypothetical protein
MRSKSEVHRDLDIMRGILAPLDDAGREDMLATMVLWFLMHHADRESAIAHLVARVAEIEQFEREILQ